MSQCRKLILDENSAEAHTILAKMKMDNEHEWTATEKEFKRAIELNPNYALAHHWFGEVYLSAMGRFDESIRVDPLLDSLRDDARFKEIEEKLNLP